MWRVAVVLLAAGCGRIGFGISHGSSGVEDSGDDTGGTAGTCKTWGAFGAPMRIPEVGAVNADDWGPFVTADNLAMYLFSNRPGSMNGSLDIWVATRSDPTATFSTPILAPNVNSALVERSPWVSRDGLTLGFASSRAGGLGMHDIYEATRSDVAQAFGAPTPVANVNTASDEFFSIPNANGLRLYMVSSRLGSLDIFVATRATTAAPFGTPTPIAELNTPQNERHVAVSSDELEVFVDSDCTGSAGVDIYTATRPDLASSFSTLQPIPQLNSAMDEVAPSLSIDGSTLYYAYSAVTAGGDAEVWFATRPCLD